jgi:enterochelin esterase-like enzyme
MNLLRFAISGILIFFISHAQADSVTFSLVAPNARKVYLAGEMTNWDQNKVAMLRGEGGVWQATVELEPGEWLYKFVVDGKWIHDPATSDHDADGRGGQHSYLFVGDGAWKVEPSQPHGQVQTHSVKSNVMGRSMKVNIYLPPDYKKGDELPVLWLLHGGGMDADQWLKTGHVERYFDNLLAKGAVRPFIVVMPSGGRDAYFGASEQFISKELPKWLAANYGIKSNRTRSALAGMSAGGYGTVVLGIRHPDLYGFGYALAGWYPPELLKEVAGVKAIPIEFVMRCGVDDDLLGMNQELAAVLNKRMATYEYKEVPGAHTFHLWGQRLPEILTSVSRYFDKGVPLN